MKKILIIILLVCSLFIIGCESKEIELDNVYMALESDYKGYIRMDEDTLEGVYGIDLDVFDDYIVVMDETSTTSKMYAVFEIDDNMEEAEAEAKYFVNQYKESWLNGYFPEEEALVLDGKYERYGNYIIYVVNKDALDIIKRIKEA